MAQQQINQSIEQSRMQAASTSDQLRMQIEVMKNEADNHQKQTTELLKNRDDNETKLMLEQMKAQLDTAMSAPKEQQMDLTPQLKELTSALDTISKQRTDDALTEVMLGLRATVEQLSRPKMLIKDANGRTIGVQ
jgi:hypothetical protein